ncbi:MAG: Gfo/Idh/MocA family protein [Terriglobia bacterium]
MDRVRIGIIGLGVMGELYAKVYSTHPLSELSAVCSLRQDRVDELKARFSVPYGDTDYRRMLERADLDAVVVATPDHQHFEPTRAVLASGRHALVEKPFTTNLGEADELIRIAGESKRFVQVAFNHRWLAPYYQAKQVIQSGEIGVPLAGYARKNDTLWVPTDHIGWAGQTTSAWFLSSHDIDLLRWWLDAEPVEARAWGRKEVLAARGIPTFDIIQAQVKFASGAFITFESGWIYPKGFPALVDSLIQVVGSKGHVSLDRKYESLEVSTDTKFSYPKGFLTAEIFGRLRGAFPNCLEDFLRSIRDGIQPGVTAFDGRQVTATLIAIHRSLETGNTEAIAAPPADIHGTSRDPRLV